MKPNKGDIILLLTLGFAMLIWLANGLREVMNDRNSVASLVIVTEIALGMDAYDRKALVRFFAFMIMAVTLATIKIVFA